MASEMKLTTLEHMKQLAEKVKEVEKSAETSVFTANKTEPGKSDGDIIREYFTSHTDAAAHKGDVFIVETSSDDGEPMRGGYIYNGESWLALDGAVDADKVIMRGNITMAGNYTQVGNKTKTQTGTASFETNGKSVSEILTEIFSQRLQPTVTSRPSLGGFVLTGAGAVEAGTKLSSVSYTAPVFNPGAYIYGPETGVVCSQWKVERITNSGSVQIQSGASPIAGTDDNDKNGFVIGESDITSLKYKVTAEHGAGVTANDNLGSPSEPEIRIEAGNLTRETSAYTPYRNYFYGATNTKPELNSGYIRGLTKSGKAYAAGTVTLNVAAGSERVVIACENTKTGVTRVINETALNADVTDTFTRKTVSVEGANGYLAKEYNVWVFEPANPYENAAVLKVTLG